MITYNECLKKLIDLGKETGYITFKQINDILPSSPFFLDKVDDIIFDLSQDGIEIIDETEKGSPEAELQSANLLHQRSLSPNDFMTTL